MLVYQPELKTVDVLVTGDSTGTVIGTELYAISSDLPAVAVHQGLLKHGERGIIHVEFLPPQEGYTPSTRNGVTSGTLINWPGAIRVRRIGLVDGDQSESD